MIITQSSDIDNNKIINIKIIIAKIMILVILVTMQKHNHTNDINNDNVS